ncbi:MAG: hypothetical protein WBW04_19085 [Nitrolancea sp.]
METTSEGPVQRDATRTIARRSRSRTSTAGLGPFFGVVFIMLALIWVMNLESTLPSIRVGDQPISTGAARTLEPGTYTAENDAISLSGNWFRQTLGSNESSNITSLVVTGTSGSVMSFRFYGTDLSMAARIGPESGKVYVSIDGNPSTLLPTDSKGSYLDLFAEQAEDQSIPIASGLAHRDHDVTITSDGTDQVAISGFAIAANTPFPWAFVFLYVALGSALFVLVRMSVIGVCRRLRWMT